MLLLCLCLFGYTERSCCFRNQTWAFPAGEFCVISHCIFVWPSFNCSSKNFLGLLSFFLPINFSLSIHHMFTLVFGLNFIFICPFVFGKTTHFCKARLTLHLWKKVGTAHFFKIRMPYFSLSLNTLKFIGFEPYIILKLFLNIKGVTTPENLRNIFISRTDLGGQGVMGSWPLPSSSISYSKQLYYETVYIKKIIKRGSCPPNSPALNPPLSYFIIKM